METDEPNYVLYILMRTDLPSLNPGKAMAQSGHACNAFINCVSGLNKKQLGDLALEVKMWAETTTQGFGTVLVLGATKQDIHMIKTRWKDKLYNFVVDPTYPYIVNSEIKDLIDPKFLIFRLSSSSIYILATGSNIRPNEQAGASNETFLIFLPIISSAFI